MAAKTLCIALLSCFALNLSFGQQYDGFKGTSGFSRYDNTHISPDSKGKHGASVGFTFGNLHPQNDFIPRFGGHIGYNFILMKKRKRVFGIKEVSRDEPKWGIGAHLTVMSNSEFFFTVNYMNPLFSMRGKLLSLYWLGEYGIGFHNAQPTLEDPGGMRLNLSLEVLRIRFGKSPLNLTFTGHYDGGNRLLSKKRMNVASLVCLRYYIYKKK